MDSQVVQVTAQPVAHGKIQTGAYQAGAPPPDGASSAGPAQAPPDGGLRALCGIASFYRIAADPGQLAHELALGARESETDDLLRAATLIGLKARRVKRLVPNRLKSVPAPAIVRLRSGAFGI